MKTHDGFEIKQGNEYYYYLISRHGDNHSNTKSRHSMSSSNFNYITITEPKAYYVFQDAKNADYFIKYGDLRDEDITALDE